VSGDTVDLSARHADIRQLPVTQVVQARSQPLALALLLKRTPISLEQAQDAPRDGEVEAEPCGIAPGLGCEVRLLGWHRMLLLLRTAGRVAKQKAPSDAGGAW
jgi:hypothetical protein